MKKDMQVFEGESVARQVNGNREWTQIDANADAGRLCGGLAQRRRIWSPTDTGRQPPRKETERDVLGSTPSTAVDPSPLHGSDFRAFASIRGWRRKFSMFQDQLMQVVDVHDFSGYFSIVADISRAFFWHAWRKWRQTAKEAERQAPKNKMRQTLQGKKRIGNFWRLLLE